MKYCQEKIKKIGIDARFFGPKDKGFGRYTKKLVDNLQKIDKKNQYFIFLRKNRYQEYNFKNKNFRKILAEYKWYGVKEQVLFSKKIKKYNLDLMHFTHFNVPIFYNKKFIVTIHDLTLRKFPTYKKNLKNLIFYPFKDLVYRVVFRHAIKDSEKIIAISKYTKQEILRYYKVDPDKIEVIYEGTSKNLQFSVSNFQSISNSQLPKKYILYVGNNYPHKNLDRLKLAFEKLKKDGLNYELILNTEFISEEKLDKLYRNASLYVFPSLSEGFGLPPLEAMARGVPVVSSNYTCLPEILGNAAVYFNPLDINDMANKIKKVLLDKNLQEKLIQKGYKQIKKYFWQKMADKTLKAYKEM